MVHIEIPKGSTIKTEYYHHLGMPVVDRVLHGSNYYFFNYGFLPQSLSGDADPLDVVIFCDEPLPVSHLISCKVLGFLRTIDDAGMDEKLVVVPDDKVDPHSIGVEDISDLHSWRLERLRDFFSPLQNIRK